MPSSDVACWRSATEIADAVRAGRVTARAVVEVSLAHQEGDRVRKAYNHAVYVEQRLTLMQQWGDFVTTDKVDGEQAEGVHKLVKKA